MLPLSIMEHAAVAGLDQSKFRAAMILPHFSESPLCQRKPQEQS